MSTTLEALEVTSRIVTPILSVAAILLSVRATRIAAKQSRLAHEKAAQEERAELARVLWESTEMAKKVGFLDEWIFKRRIFTRQQAIIDALATIRDYWKKNDESLRGYLGSESRLYQALRGLYDVALQNEDNQPPIEGYGEWRGITQTNLLGYTVSQLFYDVPAELQKKRG